MGRGLSDEQKKILAYLKDRQDEGMEVVPLHWMLIDICGLVGEKGYYDNEKHIDTFLSDNYLSKKVSLSNSIAALRKRNLIWLRKGVTRIEEKPNFPSDGKGTHKYHRLSHGYCLANSPVSEYIRINYPDYAVPEKLWGWSDNFEKWEKAHEEEHAFN